METSARKTFSSLVLMFTYQIIIRRSLIVPEILSSCLKDFKGTMESSDIFQLELMERNVTETQKLSQEFPNEEIFATTHVPGGV